MIQVEAQSAENKSEKRNGIKLGEEGLKKEENQRLRAYSRNCRKSVSFADVADAALNDSPFFGSNSIKRELRKKHEQKQHRETLRP